MKKETLKRLKEAAATLPPMYVNRDHTVNGEELIKAGVKVTAGGEPIQETTTVFNRHKKYVDVPMRYKAKATFPVNHFEKMKAAYKKGGLQAAQDYMMEVHHKHFLQQQAKEAEQKASITA